MADSPQLIPAGKQWIDAIGLKALIDSRRGQLLADLGQRSERETWEFCLQKLQEFVAANSQVRSQFEDWAWNKTVGGRRLTLQDVTRIAAVYLKDAAL